MPDIITAGFMPLTDSAILVAARECGFAEQEGIALNLIRETSWANIRDRMAVGHFEAAHMLAPMPVASNLGMTPLKLPMIAPMALGLGGNAVTVSTALWRDMAGEGAGDVRDPKTSGQALRRVLTDRASAAGKRLQLAVVHPHSGHNFDLRYWLAACGIDPRHDVDIVIVPPPLMPDALASGQIDGFCVGEPWNTVAVAAGHGRIVTVKSAIWKYGPEKVLGVRSDWAQSWPEPLARLLRALYRAAQWCGVSSNRQDLAEMLSDRAYLNLPRQRVERALTGRLLVGESMIAEIDDFFTPSDRFATFPWPSHALWFYSQMVRWGQIDHAPANIAVARSSYRPDIYRAALAQLGASMPDEDLKTEGSKAHNKSSPESGGFFDGLVFDPVDFDGYLTREF